MIISFLYKICLKLILLNCIYIGNIPNSDQVTFLCIKRNGIYAKNSWQKSSVEFIFKGLQENLLNFLFSKVAGHSNIIK